MKQFDQYIHTYHYKLKQEKELARTGVFVERAQKFEEHTEFLEFLRAFRDHFHQTNFVEKKKKDYKLIERLHNSEIPEIGEGDSRRKGSRVNSRRNSKSPLAGKKIFFQILHAQKNFFQILCAQKKFFWDSARATKFFFRFSARKNFFFWFCKEFRFGQWKFWQSFFSEIDLQEE